MGVGFQDVYDGCCCATRELVARRGKCWTCIVGLSFVSTTCRNIVSQGAIGSGVFLRSMQHLAKLWVGDSGARTRRSAAPRWSCAASPSSRIWFCDLRVVCHQPVA